MPEYISPSEARKSLSYIYQRLTREPDLEIVVVRTTPQGVKKPIAVITSPAKLEPEAEKARVIKIVSPVKLEAIHGGE